MVEPLAKQCGLAKRLGGLLRLRPQRYSLVQERD